MTDNGWEAFPTARLAAAGLTADQIDSLQATLTAADLTTMRTMPTSALPEWLESRLEAPLSPAQPEATRTPPLPAPAADKAAQTPAQKPTVEAPFTVGEVTQADQ